MKIKFDLSGAVKKVTGINEKLGGDASLDAHLEVEFGADELGMIYEAQRALVPEVLNFVKEMQQLSNKNKEENKMTELEKNRLETRIGYLETRLENEKEKSSRHEKDKEFWKSKCQDILKGGKKEDEEESDLI